MACTTSTTIATASSAAPAAPASRSWAQIVKKVEAPEAPAAAAAAPKPAAAAQKAAGKEVAEAKASTRAAEGGSKEKAAPEARPLVPAIKGTMLCKCTGQVLAMKGHYGWILPLEPIDHPVGLSKNEGHVYVSTKDVEGGILLGPGDFVSFYLYVDAQGLGAEACCLTSRATVAANTSGHKPPWSSFAFSVAAAEFVPTAAFGTQSMSAGAAEFVPAGGCSLGGPSGMSADASEFVPAAAAVQVATPAPLPEPQLVAVVRSTADVNPPPGFNRINVSEINAAYFSDSESSEEEGAEAGDEAWSFCSEGEESGLDGEEEEEEEGGCEEAESKETSPAPKEDFEEVEVDDELDVVVMCAPLKARRQRATSPDGSTSAGGLSDSEGEFLDVLAPLCPVRVPPGLSVLAG